jgi:biopolymer transport protein ExbD
MNDDNPAIPIAPMIDCVFLLLVYFMVTSSLDREETDIGCALPGSGTAAASEAWSLPEEQVLEIRADGAVLVNGLLCDPGGPPSLPELSGLLHAFRAACADGEPLVTLAPAAEASHQQVIRVLDAVHRAGIQRIHFALGSDGGG